MVSATRPASLRAVPGARAAPRPSWLTPALCAILVGSLGVRLAYLGVYAREMPLYRTPLVDARIYADWASAIASGDVWSVAEGVFYRAPLYPYLLAGLLSSTGGFQPWISLLQIALGLFVVWGSARLAEIAAGPVAAVAAAILLGFYGPMIATESKLLATSLGLALLTALLLSVVRSGSGRSGTTRWRLVGGLVLGLAVLVRPQWLALGALLPLAAAPPGSWRRPSALGSLLAWWPYALGAALVIAPVAVRNRVIGDDWVLVSANGGMTFFQGNNAENESGLLTVIKKFEVDGSATEQRALETRAAEEAAGRTLRPSEVSSFWTRQALSYIASDPVDWLRLEGQKLFRYVTGYEYADNYSYYIEQSRVWPLRLAAVPVGLILALAVGACVLLGLRPGRLDATDSTRPGVAFRIVLLTAAFGLVGCLAFYVSSRYRMESAPALAVLAGVGISHWIDGNRRRVRGGTESEAGRGSASRPLIASAATAALVFGLTCWPPGAPARSQESITWLQLGHAFESQKRTAEAEAAYRRSVRILPQNVFAWNTLALSRARSGSAAEGLAVLDSLAPDFQGHPLALYSRGYLLSRLDREEEAISVWREALQANPMMREAHVELALAYERKRDWDRALQHLTEARRLGDRSSDLLAHLGFVQLRRHSFGEARDAYRLRIAEGEREPGARLDLAIASFYDGRATEAESLLAALPDGTDPPLVAYYRGLAAVRLGDGDAAREHLERAFTLDPALRADYEQWASDNLTPR